jgi:DNA-binding CsgD family transcriptional regulator
MEARPPEKREPKKDAVVALIRANPDKSANEIARLAGVSGTYVKTLRQGAAATTPVVVT